MMMMQETHNERRWGKEKARAATEADGADFPFVERGERRTEIATLQLDAAGGAQVLAEIGASCRPRGKQEGRPLYPSRCLLSSHRVCASRLIHTRAAAPACGGGFHSLMKALDGCQTSSCEPATVEGPGIYPAGDPGPEAAQRGPLRPPGTL